MKARYEVTKTKNGFVIELHHENMGGMKENLYVAKSISEVVRIIKKLLLEHKN